MSEMYFEMISATDVEEALSQMGYTDLEYNGEETHLDGLKVIHYIGYLDTTYEIQIEILTPIQLKVRDRMVEEKHYCYHGKAIKLNNQWKISYK